MQGGGDAADGASDARADGLVSDGADANTFDVAMPNDSGFADVVITMDAAPDTAQIMDAATGSDTGPIDVAPVDASSRCSTCDNFTTAMSAGGVDNVLIPEASGIVASRAHPGVLYVHNDSGDTPRFFAIDTAGRLLGEYHVTGATAHDWEDISIGPCPSGTCVYLADVGDNAVSRAQYQVYRVPEPDVQLGRNAGIVNVTPQRFPFVYPNGSHNCETLMVHPNGRVYLVTKVGNGMSEVFRFPMPMQVNTEVTLQRVAGLTVPAGGSLTTTGGDIHPCANRFLLRVYDRLFEYRVAETRPFDDVFGATPVMVPVAGEPQGEAVAYHADGEGYFTISESPNRPAAVNDYHCR